LGLAFALLRLLISLSPPGTPGLDKIGIDSYVLGFTFVVAMLTGLFFGLAPALQLSKADLNHALKDTGKGVPGGSRGGRLRGALVITEIVALILLIGSGLLMKSFILLQRVDPGFNPDHLVTLSLILNRTSYPGNPQVTDFYSQLLDRVKALPGVQSTALISTLPLSGNETDTNFLIEGRPAPLPNQQPTAWFNLVSPEYFKTMELPLIKGRSFTALANEISSGCRHQRDDGPAICPKNIGQEVGRGRIVGVKSSASSGRKHFGLAGYPPTMYMPVRRSRRAMTLNCADHRGITSEPGAVVTPGLEPAIAIWRSPISAP
jgi:hypothetical protein